MSYTVKRFDETMVSLLPRKQEPFDIIGRIIPVYNGVEWILHEELLDELRTKTYLDDIFDPKVYINNPNEAAFLAMYDDECIGSLRIGRRWNKNAFVDDLEISRIHRGHGVGTMLMNEAVRWSITNGYHGISLETQDWNLIACRFYIKYGFKLGGIDYHSYDAYETNRNEIALYFYLLPDNPKWKNFVY